MPIRTEPVLPEEDWQLRLDPPEDGSGVGTLTLAYPEKLNMWSWEATRQLGVLADRARFDDRIRVLLVKAEGRAFCAGINLGMPEDRVTGRSPAEKVRNYYEGSAGCTSASGSSTTCPSRSWARSRATASASASSWRSCATSGWRPTTRSSRYPRRRRASPSMRAETSAWLMKSVPAMPSCWR